MSETLSQSEPVDIAMAAVRPVGVLGTSGAEGVKSNRVLELPPPPKASDELRLPHIEVDTSEPAGGSRPWPRWTPSSCMVSFLFHFCLLMILGFWIDTSLGEGNYGDLLAGFNEPGLLDSVFDDELPETVSLELGNIDGDPPELDERFDVPKVVGPDDNPRRAAFGLKQTELTNLLTFTGAATRGGLEGRNPAKREGLLRSGGGTRQSERAVRRGLRWLAAHQLDDGSWSFDHNKSICRGQCRNTGVEPSTTASTAMALLPFLGAGHTHIEGDYQDNIRRGLYYLGKRARLTANGTDLREGTMYGHGLATIALCEAYAMTDDPGLQGFAQGAIDFIVYAQDVSGGGWRYMPGEPGDTTVTGWQLMGLKSGQMAGLSVPSPTIFQVRRFLDGVQYDDGSQYGYMGPRPRKTTTAVGLLCRMYTGWRHNHPALQRGVVYLSNWGPSQENIYYNYYATQVMRHWGDRLWKRWNAKMREQLINTQATKGHESGSWYFNGDFGSQRGGRLYCTAMAVMTLEVYYRYMPLYGRESVESGF